MSIADAYRNNYQTLLNAAAAEQLAIMECTDVKTGKSAILVCAVNIVDGEYELVPLARMLDGDPYKDYLPPAP